MSESAILCVDDEYFILESLKEQLKRRFGNRYIYEIAETAAEAFDAIAELESEGIRIIIILSDWLMPGMKGDEFLAIIHQKFPKAISIMLTGQAYEKAIATAKEKANLYACLYKPWKEEELIDIINSALK
jgi:CheY-like chemotaxis protein